MTRRKPARGPRLALPASILARSTTDLSLTVLSSERPCRDVDPELFFPIGTTGPAIQQAEDAKAVCGSCPVRYECLELELRAASTLPGEHEGVFGGTTPKERDAEVQARRQAAKEAEEAEEVAAAEVAEADPGVDVPVLQPVAAGEVAA